MCPAALAGGPVVVRWWPAGQVITGWTANGDASCRIENGNRFNQTPAGGEAL